MAEDREKTLKDWLRILLPRVLRAAFFGFLMGGELLILLFIPDIGGRIGEFFPAEQIGFSYLLFLFIGFEVAIQLFRGTIIPYILSIGRALTSMIVFIWVTNGGVMTFPVSSISEMGLPPDLVVSFTVGFRVVLAIFLILLLLTIIKNLLKAVDFLSEKAEEPTVLPEFP